MDNKIKYLELDNASINNLTVNKILVKNNKNIININSLNCSNLILNDNDNNSILITDSENLDINIKLNTTVIGTKYIIKLTKKQNTLKIWIIRKKKKEKTQNVNNVLQEKDGMNVLSKLAA